ncbi:MAG: hypothetical protein RI885_2007 [Actinomycetota bacterium]|jgi:RND superfamily putative drug exporter
MATLLYRLGRFSYRHAWRVIAVWMLLLVGILGGGVALGGQTEESFAIPGTESQEALDRLEAVFPQVAGASATAVVVAEDGSSVRDDQATAAIADMVDEIARIDGVDAVVGPFDEYAGRAVTGDGSMALIKVQFDGPSTDVTPAQLDELTATSALGEDAGLRVEFGGQVFQDNTVGITVSEVFGVVFAGIVLVITFGSLLAAGMPLLTALIGVGIVIGGITTVSAFTSVSSSAPLLALMIGLAVGIDYALFILSRHRGQLAEGEQPEESAAMAVGTAGSAVVFAGLTVIIALLGLLVVGIPFLSVMGVGAAFAVLVAIGVATTLLPAVLGLAKARLVPKEGSRAWRRAHAHGDGARPTMGLRWVGLVMRAPIVAVIAVVGILGVLSIPAANLDLNLPDGGSEPEGSTQREAYDLITEGFGPGYNGPLIVAVDITQTTDILGDLGDIGDELRTLPGVDFVSDGIPDTGLDTAIIQVTPQSAPDSAQTKELVQTIRDLAPELRDRFDTEVSVTGTTAIGIDISNRLTSALIPFGLIVVGLSIILLMMVFRSILVPIKAAVGFLLSVGSSFGVVVAIFQWGWFADLLDVENPGPILSFMPILLMAVLFGLAMDYEVFLVSGMREEFVHSSDARQAVRRGFGNGARVVTAAALIMFFVFFAFVPEGSGTIKPIALGLAVGIAFDAFLVRMTLVPAVMTLLGRSAWWLPRWLARILPDVDIEGDKLRAHRADVEWAATQTDAALAATALVAGRPAPVTFSAPVGSLVLVRGEAADRRALIATLAGRILPVSGRAHVLGHPLPSERSEVSRLVAVSGLMPEPVGDDAFDESLAERLRLTGRRSSRRSALREAARWRDRLDGAVRRASDSAAASIGAVDAAGFRRALAPVVLAFAEQTPVVMIDSAGGSVSAEAFLDGVLWLAPSGITVVVGLESGSDAGEGPDRDRDRVVTEVHLAPRATEATDRRRPVPSTEDSLSRGGVR